jgi:hypothetical protein
MPMLLNHSDSSHRPSDVCTECNGDDTGPKWGPVAVSGRAKATPHRTPQEERRRANGRDQCKAATTAGNHNDPHRRGVLCCACPMLVTAAAGGPYGCRRAGSRPAIASIHLMCMISRGHVWRLKRSRPSAGNQAYTVWTTRSGYHIRGLQALFDTRLMFRFSPGPCARYHHLLGPSTCHPFHPRRRVPCLRCVTQAMSMNRLGI